MTLIVQCGDVADADSLCGLTYSGEYHANRGNTAWAALDPARREQLLRQAYDWLIGKYGTRWPEGELFGTIAGVTMKGAKDACAQLALYAISGPLAGEMAPQVIKQKVGPIESEYAAAPNNGERAFPDVVRMMAPYLVPINRYSIPLRRT